MTYDEWEADVPSQIREDSVWKMAAYRLGLFLSDLTWNDATVLLRDPRSSGFADQLTRAAGKVISNICEGYSRQTGKRRAIFCEYALGSAHECRDWYYRSRRLFKHAVIEH